MKTAARAYLISKEHMSSIIKVLAFGSAAAVVFYGFSIYTTISRTVVIRNIESEIAKTEEAVKDLDVRFIALSSNITPEMADRYGLSRETKVAAYINKTVSLGAAIGKRSGI